MNEKVNVFEEMNKKSWLSWFILNAMKRDIMIDESYNPEEVEVKLVINGVDCPLRETIGFLGEQYNDMVAKDARELVEGRVYQSFFDKFEELGDLSETLKELMERKIEDIIK